MTTNCIEQVLAAKKASDLFKGATPDDAKGEYRKLRKQVHPDANLGNETQATKASAHLSVLWTEFSAPHTPGFTITTKRMTHTAGDLLARGDFSNVYTSTSDGALSVVKLPRSPKNSDLIEREVRTLKKLAKEGDAMFAPFYPQLLDAFKHRDASSKIERRGVVMTRHVDGFTSLANVLEAFPDGIDPRDAAWIFRRILIAVAGLHKIGIVHGAVLPENILLELEQHGLVLIDFAYSCAENECVPAMSSKWKMVYPEEVGVKLTPTPATDIYMAAKMLELMLKDRAPRQLRAFVKGCTIGAQKSRPQDALQIHNEYVELIERLYGERKFRVFPPLDKEHD